MTSSTARANARDKVNAKREHDDLITKWLELLHDVDEDDNPKHFRDEYLKIGGTPDQLYSFFCCYSG